MSNTFKVQAAFFAHSRRVGPRDTAPRPIVALVGILKRDGLASKRFGNQRKLRANMKVIGRRLERAKDRVASRTEIVSLTRESGFF